MNAALQCLLPMDAFVARYGADASRAHALECRAPSHAECFHCQMGKVVDALVSGRYSQQPPEFAAWRAARDASRAQSDDAAMAADASAAERRRADKEASDKLFRDWQPGVTPRMFKSLIAGAHPEFKTNRQQDAFEFIQYLLNEVQRRERAHGMSVFLPTRYCLHS
jgi:ubiquitin carboxyl-terminal hydrolase 5/13